jgi:hypothetical protein
MASTDDSDLAMSHAFWLVTRMASIASIALLMIAWSGAAVDHFQHVEGAKALYGLPREDWYRLWGGRVQFGLGTVLLLLAPVVLDPRRGRQRVSRIAVLIGWSGLVWMALAYGLWQVSSPLYE